MRKFRLAILGSSPCDQCIAACCKQNGHDYAVLLEGDEGRKFGPFAVEVPIDNGTCTVIERALPYRNGRCSFLGEDDRCTIYEDRPVNCRRFECVKGYHHGGGDRSGHSRFLGLNPRVLQLLDHLE